MSPRRNMQASVVGLSGAILVVTTVLAVPAQDRPVRMPDSQARVSHSRAVAAAPVPPRRRSKAQVLAILRTMPGGSRGLALADRETSRSTPPHPNSPGGLANPKPPFELHFYPGHLEVFGNSMRLTEVEVTKDEQYKLSKTSTGRSRAWLWCNLPSEGWYVFNFEGVVPAGGQVKASLRPALPGPAYQTWTITNTSNSAKTMAFPALVHAGNPGPHTLLFDMDSGSVVFEQCTLEPL